MSFLRKQESRLVPAQAGIQPSSRENGNLGCGVSPKSPSPGLAFGQAGLSHQGRGELLHSAKMLPGILYIYRAQLLQSVVFEPIPSL